MKTELSLLRTLHEVFLPVCCLYFFPCRDRGREAKTGFWIGKRVYVRLNAMETSQLVEDRGKRMVLAFLILLSLAADAERHVGSCKQTGKGDGFSAVCTNTIVFHIHSTQGFLQCADAHAKAMIEMLRERTFADAGSQFIFVGAAQRRLDAGQ